MTRPSSAPSSRSVARRARSRSNRPPGSRPGHGTTSRSRGSLAETPPRTARRGSGSTASPPPSPRRNFPRRSSAANRSRRATSTSASARCAARWRPSRSRRASSPAPRSPPPSPRRCARCRTPRRSFSARPRSLSIRRPRRRRRRRTPPRSSRSLPPTFPRRRATGCSPSRFGAGRNRCSTTRPETAAFCAPMTATTMPRVRSSVPWRSWPPQAAENSFSPPASIPCGARSSCAARRRAASTSSDTAPFWTVPPPFRAPRSHLSAIPPCAFA